jgi:hypothetical protein
MQNFVFLFRQSPVTLTEDEQARRANEVRTWALQQIAEGRKLDPRIMTGESETVARAGQIKHGWPVTALLFFQAEGMEAAKKIAESHPGLRYGVSIEVRPWTIPAGAVAASN